MKIYISRHAKRQMKWRKISEDEVRNAILDPEEVQDSIRGRKNVFKHINKKWIKVTFKEEDDKITIITAIDKSN
ncbi:MAG: DUF4258 domain-containing protein [bacterium]